MPVLELDMPVEVPALNPEPTTGVNVKLLRQVGDYIIGHAEEYGQEEWGHCIAAHTVVVAGAMSREEVRQPGYETENKIRIRARELLGLTVSQSCQLFVENWRGVADGQFELKPTDSPQLKARIAAERINHFIQTGE